MKFFLRRKTKGKLKISFKLRTFLLIFSFLFIIVAIPPRPARAQFVVSDLGNTLVNAAKYVWQKTSSYATTLWQKAGSIAYYRTLNMALNKIAYDTANYIGSGHSGQKPLFITKNWGQYLLQVGDQAAGQFVETFVNNLNNPATEGCRIALQACYNKCPSYSSAPPVAFNEFATPESDSFFIQNNKTVAICRNNCASANTACVAKNTQDTVNAMNAVPSFNVCGVSSLAAKVKIGLGLIDQNKPRTPNCSATKMVKNWQTDINQKLKDLHKANYLKTFAGLFNPSSNDLGIYVLAKTDLSSKALIDTKNARTGLLAKKGWLNVTDIAGSSAAPPGTAKRQIQIAQDIKAGNLGKITGDVFVDAANVFLNRLAMSAFNRLIQGLGKSNNASNASYNTTGFSGYSSDPNARNGITAVKEITSTLLKPKFNVQADYSILAKLAVCPDAKNPGPTDCVIDGKFLQAISEKKTVAEALSNGYLHGNWQMTTANNPYSYSLRNVSILRKYRILSVGWEEAITRANNIASPQKITLNDLVSCFSPNDQYNTFSSNFDPNQCYNFLGLVDPNWVLKAPLNYCKKEGFGAQILNRTIYPGIAANSSLGMAATLSKLSIIRADNYCADGQTCIKENSNGTCEAYGYCNGEKRTWSFGGNSCKPIDNTCQAFINPNGQTISYLQNTLNYGDCNSGNTGCRQYSLNGTYNTSTNAVIWNAGNSLYFNDHLNICSNQDEGCTGLLRVKSTWGNNLVMNSDFSNDQVGDSTNSTKLNDWPLINTSQATIVDINQDLGSGGGKALKLNIGGTAGGVYSDYTNSLLPANLQIISSQAYTVSADVYLINSNKVVLAIGNTSAGFTADTSISGSWQHLSVTRPAESGYNNPTFSILISRQTAGAQLIFYVKNIKFEVGAEDTGYSPYGYQSSGSAKIYEKLLPQYLAKSCYVNAFGATKDYTLKANAPAICSSYARKCNQAEVGCDAYTNVKDNFTVAAKTSSKDYCPTECLGYDVYITRGSYFNSPLKENLIPKTATSCQVAAVGCSEFTNLDTLAQGGEQKEYYTSLKQCIKPSATKCGNFYAWQGQAGGYQLQAYSLEKDANNLPLVTSNDGALCNATIYNLPVSDPNFNLDCQQFYNTAGQVSYHLISKTIACSDNCHTYRMTSKNVDSTITSANACVGVDKHWNSVNNRCNVCLNGGTWDNTSGACLYNAIPGQGKTCRANQNGCREYNGNTGSNVKLITYYDFENGLSDWSSSCSGGSGLNISSISNNKDGHSLAYTANACPNQTAQLDVSGLVSKGSAYTLKFLGLAPVNTSLEIHFVNKDTGTSSPSSSFSSIVIKGKNSWNIYQANLPALNQAVGANEKLVITANGNFYLDDFILSEITDRYYLIKNSSKIPNSCYYDTYGNYQGTDYNLGCSQYTDRNGLKNNLHKFTKLCSVSSAGCEQMIDTNNYSSYKSGFWQNGVATSTCDINNADCVKVTGDRALYAVYDVNKQCNAASQGCSLLGQGQGGQNLTGWSKVFKLNNPNQYNKTLCSQVNVGCEAWSSKTDHSISYFKDPGNKVCIYRASQDPSVFAKDWYKIPAKRCDLNNDQVISGSEKNSPVCLNDSDCTSAHCITDNNDYLCNHSVFKTIGLGGNGNQISTPSQDAGICPASASGCTEYIDPVTKFAANIITNPSFQQTNNSASLRDGWGSTTDNRWNNISPNQQVVKLSPNKLYSLVIKTKDANSSISNGVSLSFLNVVKPLLSDNNLGTSTNDLQIPFTTKIGDSLPLIFDSLHNNVVLLTGGSTGQTVDLKELAINYQLANKVDKTSCNGQVKFDNGCILFNARTINGAKGLASLKDAWNAYTTKDGQAPAACEYNINGSCTANQLIKVRPDRVCSRWLSCLTYTQDPLTKQRTCYALGECDRLDDKNDCADFIKVATTTLIKTATYDANATGYSLINDYPLSRMKEVGLNTEAHFDFEEAIPALSCKRNIDFKNSVSTCHFDKNIVADSLVRQPKNAPTDYPAHGKTYLKVPATYQISPLGTNSYISLELPKPDHTFDYYLDYLVNTKTSGLGAKVIITDQNGIVLTDAKTDAKTGNKLIFYSTGNQGWTRIINKFTVNSNSKAKINIYLTSDTKSTKTSGYVYFDDINIEPVLQVAPDRFIAKECRLYPTADSLTCLKTDSNTIANGLEGYCLEHDPFNTKTCLLWYPVDKIVGAKGFPTTLGYKGKFPLNYCTQANGNFDFVEKRVGYQRAWDSGQGWFNVTGGTVVNGQYGSINTNYQEVSSSTYRDFPPESTKFFWRFPPGVTTTATIKYNITHPTATSTIYTQYLKLPAVLGSTATTNGFGCFRFTPNSTTQFQFNSFCNPNYIMYVSRKNDDDYNTHIWCVPGDNYDSSKLLIKTGGGTIPDDLCSGVKFYNGWGKYDDFYSTPAGQQCHDSSSICPGTNEATNASPPIRIYDYNYKPADENGLKLIASSDPSEVFRLSCNQFTETVNGNNDNKAWVARVDSSSVYPTSTPPFFSSTLQSYGRNRLSTPFGAATWPDNYDLLTSSRIPLRNQYSTKNNEKVFAGRPYGCSGGDCGNIGYCSADPNVYCLYNNQPSNDLSSYNISQISCGGLGTCQPLNLNAVPEYKNTLKNIFLKSYNSFGFGLNNSFGYVSDISSSYNFNSIPHCGNNKRIPDSTFCSVYPVLSNVKIYYGDNKIPYASGFDIKRNGIYRLEFNSQVDPEQQPLRRIYIDWGDGSNQIITDQDQHPSPSNPHVFYHYYSQTGIKDLAIKITDNWGNYINFSQ